MSCQFGHPHLYVLQAPENIQIWEPSAAVVIDDILWVANDKEDPDGGNTLAAYSLPLKTWKELQRECEQDNVQVTDSCEGNKPTKTAFISGAQKIEAGALLKGQAIWWDTMQENTNVACTTSFCEFNEDHQLLKASNHDNSFNAILKKLVIEESEDITDKNLSYVTVEGLAVVDEHTWWVGVRKIGKKDDKEVYWTAIVDQDGNKVWGGGILTLDHKEFAISGLTVDGNTLWATLSYESLEDNKRKDDVDGHLARGSLATEGGKIEMQLCMDKRDPELPLKLIGKPESITVYKDKLVVIYDNDKNRKQKSGKPYNSDLFPIQQNQEYVDLIDKHDCSLEQAQVLKLS